MNGVFHIGATGLDAQQHGLEIIANNIANLNTPAYKQSHAQFSQLMATSAPDVNGMVAPARHGFMGVRLSATPVDFTQGTLTQTSASLDVAINGTGFIELMGPGGQTLLWRGGTLQVNTDGYLAAGNGMPLLAMISVPHDVTSITIGGDGRVAAVVDKDAAPTEIGRIDLVRDAEPAALTAMSGGLYAPSAENNLIRSEPGLDGAGLLVQGFIEASNVDLSREMVTLMLMQRTYAANAHIVQAGDQLMGIANDLKR